MRFRTVAKAVVQSKAASSGYTIAQVQHHASTVLVLVNAELSGEVREGIQSCEDNAR